MNNLTQEQWAYVAGFIEGDGFIYYGKNLDRRNGKRYTQLRVGIVQKDMKVLEYFQELIGEGTISPGTVSGFSSERVPQIRFSTSTGKNICKKIEKYLILKREKALILAEYDFNYTSQGTVKDKNLIWPYFAGLMDSDGTINIYNQSQKVNGKKYTYPTPKVQLGQSNKPFLDELKIRVGFGSVVKRGKTVTGKTMYNFGFGSKQARTVCENILPYLVFRKENAEFVLNMKPKVPSNLIANRPEVQEAIKLYDQGYTVRELGKKFGVSGATINNWVKKLGKTRTLAEAQKLRREREKQDE